MPNDNKADFKDPTFCQMTVKQTLKIHLSAKCQ